MPDMLLHHTTIEFGYCCRQCDHLRFTLDIFPGLSLCLVHCQAAGCENAGQLNEIELENQQLKSSIEDFAGRCSAAQSQQQTSADKVQQLQCALEQQQAQAQALTADLEAAR